MGRQIHLTKGIKLVDVWLPYGRTEVCARIPTESLKGIIEADEAAGVENPLDEIKESLKNPVSAESLAEIVKPGSRVALALNIFDPVIDKLIVSSVLEELAQSGLKADDLTVFLSHEIFNSGGGNLANQLIDELSPLGVNVVLHDISGENVYVGETSAGIKVYLNRFFAESEVKIAAGTVKPDPYILYEWSGCSVIPGLSNLETAKQIFIHALNLDFPSDLIYESIAEASQKAGIDFSINILVNRNGEIVKSVAGDMDKAFSEASKIADKIYRVPIESGADIVFISSGGAPFDASFSKACRCLENALKTVRRRGVIVLVAECPEGYGDLDFYESLSRFRNDLNSLGKSLRRRFTFGGFVAYRFLRALRKANIAVVSAMPEYYFSEISSLKIFRTANEALNYALEERGKKAKISVFPHGNFVIPEIKKS